MIIAVDFDGTLSLGEWPNVGPPNKKVVDAILQRQKTDDKIILWTCRSGKELRDAVTWCAAFGIRLDAVNENLPEILAAWGNDDTRKIYADEYWDDKNISLEDLNER